MIDITEFVRTGLPNAKTYPELVTLCRDSLDELGKQTLNNWAFTRYAKIFQDMVFLTTPNVKLPRTAVGMAMFDPEDEGALFVGGASQHPEDMWNPRVGRVVASLRLLRVPFELAVDWMIADRPWDLRPNCDLSENDIWEGLDLKLPITDSQRASHERKQQERAAQGLPKLDLEPRSVIPARARSAVVDAMRQALWYKRKADGSLPTGDGFKATLLSNVVTATTLADDLVDKACTLPMFPEQSTEEREKLKQDGIAKGAAKRAERAAKRAQAQGETASAEADGETATAEQEAATG